MRGFAIITAELHRFLTDTTEEVTIAEKIHDKIFTKNKSAFLVCVVKYALYMAPLILHLCQSLISAP